MRHKLASPVVNSSSGSQAIDMASIARARYQFLQKRSTVAVTQVCGRVSGCAKSARRKALESRGFVTCNSRTGGRLHLTLGVC